MDQPVPKVTDKDVERVAIRDFGESQLPKVLDLLQEYGKQGWNPPGSARVRLAILKLADGDFDQISKYTEAAIRDFRDVVSMAEYPKYAKEIGFSEVSKKVAKNIINEDWMQYSQWLKRE